MTLECTLLLPLTPSLKNDTLIMLHAPPFAPHQSYFTLTHEADGNNAIKLFATSTGAYAKIVAGYTALPHFG